MRREIPVLQTERLVLRPPKIEDFPAYAALMASPRASGMGGPFDLRGAWGLFCHDVALWPLYGHGALMIELAATGTCVGQVGINHGPLFPEKELGWLLYEGFEGSGYASEAAETLRDWAFAEAGIETLVSYMDRNNRRSAAVAERLGGWIDALAPRTDPDDLVYRYTRS
ncbi:GNAT family N-acetyltransferase [Pelagibacterium limicola]|uniref:GNAT family N-acetyltransferase n=1 Tax=Pelagibacterium limicola TaxID=2791022 RepID=UPI0018AFCE32|nr:GNAT family N-acetyltransferase [Pelagibacterium limicola]